MTIRQVERDLVHCQLRLMSTDDQALGIFEHLADNPACELRWLRTLAMLYIIRLEWGKLKTLAARLERQPGGNDQ